MCALFMWLYYQFPDINLMNSRLPHRQWNKREWYGKIDPYHYITTHNLGAKRKRNIWNLLYRLWIQYFSLQHYNDIKMGSMASQITSLTTIYTTVYSGADQRTHQSSASLAFVRGIHRRPVNSPHKWAVARKMFPFDDVIMTNFFCCSFVGDKTWSYVFYCPGDSRCIMWLILYVRIVIMMFNSFFPRKMAAKFWQ